METREAADIAMQVMQAFSKGEEPGMDLQLAIVQPEYNPTLKNMLQELYYGIPGVEKNAPGDIIRRMIERHRTYTDSRSSLDDLRDNTSEFSGVQTSDLVYNVKHVKQAIDDLQQKATEAAKTGERPPAMVMTIQVAQGVAEGDVAIPWKPGETPYQTKTVNIVKAYELLEKWQHELGLRGIKLDSKGNVSRPEGDISDVPGTREKSSGRFVWERAVCEMLASECIMLIPDS